NGVPQKFVMEEERRLAFYKEWFNGFSLHGMFTNKKYNPFAPLPLKTDYIITKSAFDFFNNSKISLSERFSWREKFLECDNKRISMGSKYPIIELTGAIGVKGILHSSYQYQK